MSWIQTYSGKQFFPLAPRIEDICIEDIAHALSNICRFTGHSKRFYSVAEHSCIVSDYLTYEYQLQGLLHDASEAYLCDIAAPIKPMIPKYKEYELKLQTMIDIKFGVGISDQSDSIVKEFDMMILATEKEQLMSKEPEDWELPFGPLDHDIECWFPEKAEFEFLKRFKELTE